MMSDGNSQILLWGIFILLAIIVIAMIIVAYKAQAAATEVKNVASGVTSNVGNAASQIWQGIESQIRTVNPTVHRTISDTLHNIAPSKFRRI